jgi:hypothetical protein
MHGNIFTGFREEDMDLLEELLFIYHSISSSHELSNPSNRENAFILY